jgi:putative transposase
MYPNKTQENQIRQNVGCCRFVYNFFLDERKNHYKATKEMKSCFDLSNVLPYLKRQYPWLCDTNAQSLQQSIKDMDTAYKRFFNCGGFPKFKSKKNNKNSYRVIQSIRIIDRDLNASINILTAGTVGLA